MTEEKLTPDKVTLMMIIDAHMKKHSTAAAVRWLREGAHRGIAPFASFVVSEFVFALQLCSSKGTFCAVCLVCGF